MAATESDYHGSLLPLFASILSFRRDQIHAIDYGHEDLNLTSFHRKVTHLAATSGHADDLLSIKGIQKLLDSFLICQDEFRIVLLARPPIAPLMADFFDRAVRALDVLNAIRDGIDQLRQWLKHLDIVLAALHPGHQSIGQGHLRRAKKALAVQMLDNKGSVSILAKRNRSFGRRDRHPFRSLTWSRSCSAARQLQAIGSNLVAPRGQEIAASHGLTNPIYTMSSMLLFVTWILVAAIPCHDRGLQTHLSIPRNTPWAASIMSLHDRVMEESKKRDTITRQSSGLLKETQQIDKCVRRLMRFTETNQLQLSDEEEMEVREIVQELATVCNAMKEGLDPLERQVREVFHCIVRYRTEGFDSLSRNPE